ncbi:MAG TPA: hypothetical protein VD969_20045 [Symbiobacteriaceae bacterium]|nr:hypothetical protein [Symbiobacteriaceae bacterium]
MKRWLLGILLPCLLLVLALPAYAAPTVEMRAEASGGGRVRFGGWATILVDLTNQGAELSAELVATNLDGPVWERSPEYVVPLTLPAGAKKRVPLDLPVFNGGRIKVVLRSGGTVLQEQTVTLMNLSPDALYIGLLSDDELGVPALARLGGGREGAAQVARLTSGSFPSSAALLESFNVIALARYDTGTMSREQLRALEAWVARGGTLLLAGGPEWKRTFGALPPALTPVDVTGSREADLSSLAGLSGTPLAAKGPVSDGKQLRGQVLAADGATPLVVTDRVGTGRVVYLAADPSLEPLVGWTGLTGLLDRLLGAQVNAPFYDQGNLDNMMMGALQQFPGLGLPSAWVLGSILGGYMLLVGPISYWILKRLDRREWLWLTVPGLSLAFVGAVYGAGLGKQTNLISHRITVTEMAPGAEAATMTSYTGVYAPSRSRLDVDLGASRMVRPLAVFYGREGDRSVRIVYGDRTTVELLDLNNYSMKAFAVAEDVAVRGGLQISGVSVDQFGQLTGRIVNRLDRPVRDVQVAAGGDWESLGTLEPGQTSDEFTVDLAATNFGPKGVPMMMAPGPQEYSPENERRSMVLNALFGWERQQATTGVIAVTAWTDEPVVTPAVPAIGRTTGGTNLIYAKAPIPADPAQGQVPPGVVVGVHSSGPGYGRSPYGYSLGQGAHTFSMILPPIDPAKVAEVKLHTQIMGSSRGWSVAVKNQKTGEWAELENQAVQTLKDWQTYVGAGGLIELLIDVTEHEQMMPPTVSVMGVAG